MPTRSALESRIAELEKRLAEEQRARQDAQSAEGALRRSEELHTLAQQVARLGVFEWDLLQERVSWTAVMAELFGLPSGVSSGGPEDFYGKLIPADRKWFEPTLTAAIAARQESLECEFRVDSGRELARWIEARMRIQYRPDGTPTRLVGTAVDISTRKGADESLAQHERIYRAIGESVDFGVWVSDAQGRGIYTSDSYLRLVGMSQEQCSGTGWMDALHSDEVEALSAAWQECVRTAGWWDRQHRLRGADHRWQWVLSQGGPVRNGAGEIIYWAGVTIDIARLKSTEEALQQSVRESRLAEEGLKTALAEAEEGRRTLQVLMEHVPEGIMIADADGKILMTSRYGQRLLGTDDDTTSVSDLERRWDAARTEDQRPLELSELPLARAIAGGETVVNAELTLRSRETPGKALYLLCDAAPIRDAAGQSRGGILVWSDISQTRLFQEALRQSETELREGDRRKDEFLAMLSHELRNPLAPIQNALLLLERAPPGGEQARRAREVIGRQVGQLSRLVDDLLDVTRITRNKIPLQRRPVELNQLVRGALDDYRPLFATHGVRVELGLPSQPVLLDADPDRLSQVIGNLLQNAAKFAGRGGVTRISVLAPRDQKQAIIKVSDSGLGMSPQMLERVFEPFTQGDSTLDRSQGGLGLGLALVKGLVELHGGAVSARSDGLGQGAEFTVTLPLGQEPVIACPIVPAPAPVVQKRRVLVIEDNYDAATTLREVLEFEGQQVEVAYNGPSGLKAALEHRPDVVLCDIGLPGLSGFDVARALKGQSQMLLVALSGYAQPRDLDLAKEAGFHHHLAKPPSLGALREILRKVAGTHPPAAKDDA